MGAARRHIGVKDIMEMQIGQKRQYNLEGIRRLNRRFRRDFKIIVYTFASYINALS